MQIIFLWTTKVFLQIISGPQLVTAVRANTGPLLASQTLRVPTEASGGQKRDAQRQNPIFSPCFPPLNLGASYANLDLLVPLLANFYYTNLPFPSHLCRFHSLVIDVTMALDTLSLPVLEPLTPARLQDVTVLALSCLYAGESLRCRSPAETPGGGCVVVVKGPGRERMIFLLGSSSPSVSPGFTESAYCPQTIWVLVLSTSKGWKAESGLNQSGLNCWQLAEEGRKEGIALRLTYHFTAESTLSRSGSNSWQWAELACNTARLSESASRPQQSGSSFDPSWKAEMRGGGPLAHCPPSQVETQGLELVPVALADPRILPLPPGVSVATCMAILHVGTTQQVRTGSTSSKEEDYENDAAIIVQKCVSQPRAGRGEGPARKTRRWGGIGRALVSFVRPFKKKNLSPQLEIYDMIGQAISSSRRAGGEQHNTQNRPSSPLLLQLCPQMSTCSLQVLGHTHLQKPPAASSPVSQVSHTRASSPVSQASHTRASTRLATPGPAVHEAGKPGKPNKTEHCSLQASVNAHEPPQIQNLFPTNAPPTGSSLHLNPQVCLVKEVGGALSSLIAGSLCVGLALSLLSMLGSGGGGPCPSPELCLSCSLLPFPSFLSRPMEPPSRSLLALVPAHLPPQIQTPDSGMTHYQNFQLLGAWCLLNSLFLILNLSPTTLADKGKEKDPLAALRVRDIIVRSKEGVGVGVALSGASPGGDGWGMGLSLATQHARRHDNPQTPPSPAKIPRLLKTHKHPHNRPSYPAQQFTDGAGWEESLRMLCDFLKQRDAKMLSRAAAPISYKDAVYQDTLNGAAVVGQYSLFFCAFFISLLLGSSYQPWTTSSHLVV
ncbi:E3 ubiquitin-protein ligase UBR4, partial [Ophiophagus hannah]